MALTRFASKNKRTPVQYPGSVHRANKMQTFRWIAWISLIALAIALALQNNTPTAINVLWTQWNLSLSLLLIVTAGLGFLIGALMTAMTLHKRRPAGHRSDRPSDRDSGRDSNRPVETIGTAGLRD